MSVPALGDVIAVESINQNIQHQFEREYAERRKELLGQNAVVLHRAKFVTDSLNGTVMYVMSTAEIDVDIQDNEVLSSLQERYKEQDLCPIHHKDEYKIVKEFEGVDLSGGYI